MSRTPPWYPAKAETAIDDEADTLEVLALPEGGAIVKTSVITCPACGGRKEEIMPENQCVYFYECTHCGKALKPIFGDCCVFCSYGTVMCPSEQCRVLEDAGDSIRRFVGKPPEE